MLRALIRSPTVSLPVEVYDVAVVPAVTVIVPPERIPRLDSGVLVVTGTVPVPVAGVGEVLDVPEEEEEAEELAVEPLDDEELELLEEDCSACCTSAEIWLLTRFNAVWLAMLARPFTSLVSAVPMVLISDASALDAWLCACAWLQ